MVILENTTGFGVVTTEATKAAEEGRGAHEAHGKLHQVRNGHHEVSRSSQEIQPILPGNTTKVMKIPGISSKAAEAAEEDDRGHGKFEQVWGGHHAHHRKKVAGLMQLTKNPIGFGAVTTEFTTEVTTETTEATAATENATKAAKATTKAAKEGLGTH